MKILLTHRVRRGLKLTSEPNIVPRVVVPVGRFSLTRGRCNEIMLIPVNFKCSEETRAKVERHVKGLTYRYVSYAKIIRSSPDRKNRSVSPQASVGQVLLRLPPRQHLPNDFFFFYV